MWNEVTEVLQSTSSPGTGRIVKLGPDGTELESFDGFSNPIGVAVDRDGNVYGLDGRCTWPWVLKSVP